MSVMKLHNNKQYLMTFCAIVVFLSEDRVRPFWLDTVCDCFLKNNLTMTDSDSGAFSVSYIGLTQYIFCN